MKLIEKILKAKIDIKNTKLKKEGRNTFSKYDYFTPSQIEALVSHACETYNMLSKFDLIRNELGVFGKLTIIDCETSETLVYEMATAIPEIKATNISQQLGGCMTYTERYLKTSAFGITDNNLDFDSKEEKKPTEQPVIKSKPTLTETQFNAMMESIPKDYNKVIDAMPKYIMTEQQAAELLSAIDFEKKLTN